MNKASVPYQKRKNQPEIRAWNGLNRTQGAGDGELVSCINMTTEAYPALQVRAGRTEVGRWYNATDVYETDGHLVVVAGSRLYYDGRMLREVIPGKKQFAELNRKLVIWPDKIYINLNTAEAKGMGASVSGKVKLLDGIMTVNTAGSTGSFTQEEAYGEDYRIKSNDAAIINAYMLLFENLRYADGWVYDRSSVGIPTLFGEVGDSADFTEEELQNSYYFIAQNGAPFVTEDPYNAAWPQSGTMYGRITKMTITKKEAVTDEETGEVLYDKYSARYDYVIMNAAEAGLTEFLNPGEAVAVHGSSMEYNNKEAAVIANVTREQIAMTDGFVDAASYFNVTETLAEGVYSLGGVKFKTERKIQASEQLFTVTDAGNSSLKTGCVYAYDIQSGALEQLPATEEEATTLAATAYTGTEEEILTIERTVPDLQYICERDNRLYGVSNAEVDRVFNTETGKWETVTSRVLHASALGEPTRWNVFEGASTDSYAVAVAGDGDFTAICNYSGHVIAFKEDKMFKLTGDYPAEFYLRSYSVDGVKEGCHKSLSIINEVLYYLSPYGVMAYNGGTPSLISYNLGLQSYQDAVAGRDKTNYFISMRDTEGYKIYCYDTVRGLWTIERAQQATGIERVGDLAYACIGGKIWKLSDPVSRETVTWEAELPETDEGTFDKKRYKTLRLIADVDGTMWVYTRKDDDAEWSLAGTIETPGKKIHSMNLDTMRCDRLQVRLEGEGKATIWALERTFTLEGER